MAQQLLQTHLYKSITASCKELEDLELSHDLKNWLIGHYRAESTVTALYIHAIHKLQQPKADALLPEKAVYQYWTMLSQLQVSKGVKVSRVT
jgi:hypothetical protein